VSILTIEEGIFEVKATAGDYLSGKAEEAKEVPGGHGGPIVANDDKALDARGISAGVADLVRARRVKDEEVRRQFRTIPGLMEGTTKPDYKRYMEISTDASIKEMIPPGALVMLTPLIVGTLFGVETLTGLLAGALVSGVQIAISASNTGGAWDNAKKYIEVGNSEYAKTLGPKGSDAHKAAVIGDTVGDPLKDTSGPSLNILIKLMAVESLVFAPFFAANGRWLFRIWT
jgi:Na+/H+-translocating membrane pyrophosphatase